MSGLYSLLRGRAAQAQRKASQEKKRIVLPGVPNGFCFSPYQHPVVCFRNELACVIASCKTAFVFVLLCFSCACVYFMVVINLQ